MPMKEVQGPIDPRHLREGHTISGIAANLGPGKGEAFHEVSGDNDRYNNFVHHYIHGRNAMSMRTFVKAPEGDHGSAMQPLNTPS